ncbi:MAG TPA: DnaJ domain-containing protein [Paludibacteraceae bacterium]|nr:DnaJ domain-containing protein [Paludibacteraceae bacterium]HOU67561.1 DnaJ domain-containing protein [Paludibacteraceae bacterium]HPH62388.1 DnaJ domain-containing protein [Paludibacteraceae bacterium]HQF49591.1 DnaJ domain-containing protein [Paludibacteraceae bacterium]HQJ90542.1 DnaJ domain-containing protein [Paludibacteraceae bacterium]
MAEFVIFFILYVALFLLFGVLFYISQKNERNNMQNDERRRKAESLIAEDFYDSKVIMMAVDSIPLLFSIVIKGNGVVTDEKRKIANDYFEEKYRYVEALQYSMNSSKSKYMQGLLFSNLKSNQTKDYRKCCLDILRARFTYKARYELLTVLFKIVFSDANVSSQEILLLRNIARFLLLDKHDLSLLEQKYGVSDPQQNQSKYGRNLFIHTLSQSYMTLELTPSASKDEIKRAYRRLAIRYHPDKQMNGASEADRSLAASKFRSVNEAYNNLRKARNIL